MKGDKRYLKSSLIIKQHDLTDCGPACLLSIIIYYKGYVPIKMLRNNSYTDKNGTSAYNLIKCAKKYGLSGSGIKLKSVQEISENKLPCIAHIKLKNGLNHFVVIYKITNKNLLIMDPAKGKVKLSIMKFNELFTGVVIFLKPLSKVVKINKPSSIRKLIISSLVDNKFKSIMLFLLSILLIVISVILGYYLKIGKSVIDGEITASLKNIIIIFLILYILKNVFDYIKNKQIISLNKNVSFKLLNSFSRTLFNLPLNFIRTRTSGEIISRYNELSEVNNLLPNLILSIFLGLIMSFITLCFLLKISVKLSILVIILMLIYVCISYAFKNPTLRKINKNLDTNAEFNSSVIETINNLNSIKNLNNETNMQNRMNRYCNDAIKDNYDLDNFYNNMNFIKNSIYDFIVFIASSFGLYLIYTKRFDFINLFTFLTVVNYFAEPVKDLSDNITKFCFIKTSLIKVNEFSLETNDASLGIPFTNGDIKIMNLSYAYNGINYIIKNYSCFIKRESKVLIKGASGSGKSTLCQIMSKQLTNYDGKVYINGKNITDINSNSLRKNVTYIGQKDSLIIDTIENNIKYERKIDNKKFKTICKICEIDKITNRKIDSFDSLISEYSDNISGGEKQRITLARGLIDCGNILILDESLSEVNKDMEERILKKIFKYFKDRTIIYVSHKNYNHIFDKVVKV